jgi:D-sedoheptulose 7-phosphate isomerase
MSEKHIDEATNFLYPFIDGDERDPGPLLTDLTKSALTKSVESSALRAATLESCAATIATAAAEMARRFAVGGRLFTFGNGGSSTDAATLATLFAQPSAARPLPAWSLTSDQAVLTALANDVGFDLVFVRQLIARARPDDIAVAMSTSGNSADLLLAMREAHLRGVYTIGFTGYDGGAFADNPDVDVCFVVRSQSVHRIQESHAALGYRLWTAVHAEMEVR